MQVLCVVHLLLLYATTVYTSCLKLRVLWWTLWRMVKKLTENLWAKAGLKETDLSQLGYWRFSKVTIWILILVMIPASFKDNGYKTSFPSDSFINITAHQYDDCSASVFARSEARDSVHIKRHCQKCNPTSPYSSSSCASPYLNDPPPTSFSAKTSIGKTSENQESGIHVYHKQLYRQKQD